MIFVGSRYEGSEAVSITDVNGMLKVLLHPRDLMTADDVLRYDPNFIRYTVRDDDKLDFLAWKYLGSERDWWVIAEVNSLLDPFSLVSGTELIIPSPAFLGF